MTAAGARLSRQTSMIKLLLVGSVLVPALFFCMIGWESYLDALDDAETNAQHVTSLVEEHALKTFETMAIALRYTDQRIKGLSWDEIRESKPLWQELKDVLQSFEQADSTFIIDDKAEVVATTRVFPPPSLNFSNRDYYFEQEKQDAGLFVGKAYIGRLSNNPVVSLSIRRTSPNGQFNGIIKSAVYAQYFERFFKTVYQPHDCFKVALVRQDGEVLAEYPATKMPRRMDVANLMASQDDTQSPHFRETDGRLVISKQMPGLPVYVWYSIDKSAVLNRWSRGLIHWGLLTIVMAALLSLASGIALRRAKAEEAAHAELEVQVRHRQEAEDQLRHAQKMEALGQLTGGVAHDFNNLLQVIILAASRLRRGADTGSQPSVKLILNAAQRSAHLTRQLLSFSRRHQLNPEPTDLRRKVLQAAPIVERSLRGDIQMNLSIADDLWRAAVDPVEFEMALINIGANARDAMPNGGALTISLENITLSGDETEEHLTGEFVAVALRDTGTGMSKEIMARVFEPFFTTKEVNNGTGLGLSQVYGFAQQSGGAVAIESAEGEGTCVILYLPRTLEKPADLPRPYDGWAPNLAVNRILMVEDNREIARVGAEILRELRYQVDVVDCAQDALDALAQQNGQYDLVFSDIVMPGKINGFDLAEEAAKRYPSLPVLLTTGYSVQMEKRSGNVTILQKPYELDALRRAIDEAVAKASDHDNGPSPIPPVRRAKKSALVRGQRQRAS